MDTLKFLEYAKLIFKIANFLIINKFLRKRSKLLLVLLYFGVVFLFLLKKFIQLQLLPISLTSVLNGTLASYNELLLNQYCELFRSLGNEFSVRYDRPKYWRVPELRELVNDVYSVYSALYLSVNIYNIKLSQEANNFYNNLRKLLLLFSNYFVKPTNLDLDKLVYIDIYNDIKSSPLTLVKKEGLSKLNNELDSGDSLSFLSLVHSENNPYVSDKHITNVLMEFGNLDFFEQVVSYCNNLYNISSVLKREGLKEQSRGFLSHLLSAPKYTFGNLSFLRSLMIYRYKGIHKILTVKGWNFGSVDTFFYPDNVFLKEMELKRTRLNMCLTTNSEHKYLITSLYGSDVYLNVVDNYRKVRRLSLCTNPNGGCYEFLSVAPSDIHFHVDNGRSAIIFNYPSVGLSRGGHDMNNLTAKSNYVVKYVLEYFKAKEDNNTQNKDLKDGNKVNQEEKDMESSEKELEQKQENVEVDKDNNNKTKDMIKENEKKDDVDTSNKCRYKKEDDTYNDDLVLSFHGTSLGGYFAICMGDSLGGSKKVELLLLHKTFGDLRKMSMHFVADFVGPLVRFFGLDVRSVDPFLKIDSNKILITDVNDEIIPFRCSLAYEIASKQVLPGVGKLSRSFMDYKYKTLQLLNESVENTAKRNYISMNSTNSFNSDKNNENTGSTGNTDSASSTYTYGNIKGSVNDLVVRIRVVKEMLSILGKNLNSTGQTLLNLLQSESELSTKNEVKGINTFFTRLLLYGSMPYNCIPKTREMESLLTNMYNMLHRLDLNTNYFGLFDFYNNNSNNTSNKNSKDKEEDKEKRKGFFSRDKDNKDKNKGNDKNKSGNKDKNKELEHEYKYLVRVPPKVAMYFSVLLDEVNVNDNSGKAGSGGNNGNNDNTGNSGTSTYTYGRSVFRMESDMISVHSNSSDGYYFKKRVLFIDGEYYIDFKSIGNRRNEEGHILEHLKNDLRNFGLSASRYRLSSIKLLSYYKLYSLVNVFNSLVLLNKLTDNQFKRVLLDNATGPIVKVEDKDNENKDTEEQDKLDTDNNEKDELYILYGLCKEFMYNLIQVLIEEQFLSVKDNNKMNKEKDRKEDNNKDKEKEFEYHLNKLKEYHRKYGVVIPQFTGHNAPNSALDISLITSLSRYS